MSKTAVRAGKRVLVIDMDAQGSLSASFGVQEPDELEVSIATVLSDIVSLTNKDIYEEGEAKKRDYV